ncbi:hypothetical protein N8198_05045 [Gammaproteobacteria bacterium]|nr:hypothetical protein [Gammaproteobacteria bacterium]
MAHSKKKPATIVLLATLAVVGAGLGVSAYAQQSEMTFFITSDGPGDGANLGGLEGADAHCTKLAGAAGSKLTNWKAYLSVNAKIDRSSGKAKVVPGVNARDRIGSGPWHNARGVLIAHDVDDLHSSNNPISKETGLDERGNFVNARTDKPNRHDILTGSDPSGLYSTAGSDTSCSGWTSNGAGSAIVGHHDRAGLSQDWHMLSWNSAHGTVGCGKDDVKKTGGNGLFYCFYQQ